MGSFAQLLTESAQVMRSPAESGGVVGAMAVHIAELAISPLMPVDGEWMRRVPQLAQFARTWQLFAAGADVQVGDHLQIGAVRYPVLAVESWPWRGGTHFLHLVVQELA